VLETARPKDAVVATDRPVPPARLDQPASLRPGDEAVRQRALRRMKLWATGLLGLATLIFLVAWMLEPRYPGLGIVRATAEASMVGGLADWFAVTALFRHPLGIPIPHTAIIPARKDRVGVTLGAFVQRNFLNRDVIAAKLRSIHASERIAHWLIEPENGRRIARKIARGLSSVTDIVRDEDVQHLLQRTVSDRVKAVRVAPLLGKLLAVLTEGNRHQALLDEGIRIAAKAVAGNRNLIKEKVESESPWWIPGALDNKIAEKISTGLEHTLADIHADPQHPLRLRFDQALHDFVERLQTSPAVIARAEGIKEEVLNAEVMRTFTASLWADAKAALAKYADSEEGFDPTTIQRGLQGFGQAILADPALMEKIDGWLTDAAVALVDRYENEIAELIASTVKRWDPDATSRRIELAIGRDLQFIRINGTLVGGLAGMVLYLLQRIF
jgi:uncharacterized membrane-anchored protein YjiN (DUF445 family)